MHHRIQPRFKFSDFFLKITHISFCFLKYDYICVCHIDSYYKHAFKDQRAACKISFFPPTLQV